jgi:polysaccharide biosynthesis transport protein
MSEAAPTPAPPIDVREIARVLWRRKPLLFVPWGAAALVGIAGAFLLPPIYFSSVTLMLERPQPLTGTLGSAVAPAASAETQADIMREQVKSSIFLSSVIQHTGVKNDGRTLAWAKKSARRHPGISEGEAVDLFLIDYLRNAITIRRGKGNVFQVTVADRYAERARKLAAGVADQFVASSKAAQLEAIIATQQFSAEQRQVHRRRLEESESKLEQFQRGVLSASVVGTSVGEANVQHARSLLDQAQFEAEELRQRAGSLRAELARMGHESRAQQFGSPQANTLAGQIASLERQLGTAQLNDAPRLGAGGSDNLGGVRLSIVRKHAELEVELGIAAQRAFGSLPEQARETMVAYRVAQADLAGVEARRAWLAGQVGSYERELVMTPDREIELQHLRAEVENNRQLYNSFLQQSAIAEIAEAFENAKVSGRFVVLERATRPLAPSKPNRTLMILLSLVAGAIIGVGTVMVVEHHDQSVKNADEVEGLLGLPVLGAVPRVVELERAQRRSRSSSTAVGGVPAPREHGLLHRLKVESPLGLEFRRIYLKLAKTRGRQLPRSLAITSSTRGEGKTTTAACLAITLARELRQKVLLVDFDLRSPALHRALGLPSSTWGLAQMLHQRHFDERFVRATVLPHLEFLPAGKSERPAAELIDSEAAEWFLKEALARYSMVIVDAAPNLAVPDPLILGRVAEGVLYVVKAGHTVRKAAEYGVKVQREARDNVLGVLINDAGEILPYYYGYRYNYYGYTTETAGSSS